MVAMPLDHVESLIAVVVSYFRSPISAIAGKTFQMNCLFLVTSTTWTMAIIC